jgi:hypothetical protein
MLRTVRLALVDAETRSAQLSADVDRATKIRSPAIGKVTIIA